MKSILLILVITFLGCSKSSEEPKSNIPDELIGKWKIVETYTTDGGSPATWSLYDSGEIYDIWYKKDGTFSSTSSTNPDCMSGTYSIFENQITYSNSPCVPDDYVIIESLSENGLIIDANFFEPLKTKYTKVIE